MPRGGCFLRAIRSAPHVRDAPGNGDEDGPIHAGSHHGARQSPDDHEIRTPRTEGAEGSAATVRGGHGAPEVKGGGAVRSGQKGGQSEASGLFVELRPRSAKPLFVGSIPTRASN